eukprot:1908835-Rhodomonas_salina.1
MTYEGRREIGLSSDVSTGDGVGEAFHAKAWKTHAISVPHVLPAHHTLCQYRTSPTSHHGTVRLHVASYARQYKDSPERRRVVAYMQQYKKDAMRYA